MSIMKKFGVSTLLALAFQGMVFAASTTPDLPKEFQTKKPGLKAVLMEFSAPWCGSCQKLKPYMEAIRKEAGSKLQVIELNIEKPETEKYIKLYSLVSAPTYVLYDAKGKVMQKIERDITPTELKSIVFNAIGQKG